MAASGEINISNVAQVSTVGLNALRAVPRQLVIDLTAVTFMDSTGLGYLARVLRAA